MSEIFAETVFALGVLTVSALAMRRERLFRHLRRGPGLVTSEVLRLQHLTRWLA